MAKNTIIDGIAASEHLDSSGESLSIEGMDISSLGGPDSILNWEHNSKDRPSQVVGKVTFAKKIMKKSDAKTKREKYFWNKTKKPMVYIKAELFDGVGHSGAQDVAAMLKYNNKDKGEDSRLVVGFSIEGGKMEKKGMVVTKSIARDVAITVKPCNKVCDAELIEDDVDEDFLYKNQEFDCEIMAKGEYLEKSRTYRSMILQDLKKRLPSMDNFNALSQKMKDTKSFKQKGAVADKIADAASKPMSLQPEAKPKRSKFDQKNPKGTKQPSLNNDQFKTDTNIKYNRNDALKNEKNNMRKALIAGMMGGSPEGKTGGAALASEDLSGTLEKPFHSKAQRRFAHANPEKFGGKKGIKEWEEKTPKNIPEKKKIKKSQPRFGFKTAGIENRPDMNVKNVDPTKSYQLKSGKKVSQQELERKKIANDYLQGAKKEDNVRSMDEYTPSSKRSLKAQSKQAAKELNIKRTDGQNYSDPESGINRSYVSKESKSQAQRGNYPNVREHEGIHHAVADLAQKYGQDSANAVVNRILKQSFRPETLKAIDNYIVSQGYDKKHPRHNEEKIAHIQDLLTNVDTRNIYEKNKEIGSVNYEGLKRGWKNAARFANSLTDEEIKNIYDEETGIKVKKPKIQRIPPGKSGLK